MACCLNWAFFVVLFAIELSLFETVNKSWSGRICLYLRMITKIYGFSSKVWLGQWVNPRWPFVDISHNAEATTISFSLWLFESPRFVYPYDREKIIRYSVSMTSPCFVENMVTLAVPVSYLTCLRIRSESRTIVADCNLWTLPRSNLFVLSMNISERISRFTAHWLVKTQETCLNLRYVFFMEWVMPLATALALRVPLGDMTPTRENATALAQAIFLDALAIEGVICQGEPERTLVSGNCEAFWSSHRFVIVSLCQVFSRHSHYDDDVMMWMVIDGGRSSRLS